MKPFHRDEEWQLGDVGRKAPRPGDWRLRATWAAVFAGNLPLAGYLGWALTAPRGMIGGLLAVAVLFAYGYLACTRAPFHIHARNLIVGGYAVATIQLLGMPHIVIGALGVGLAQMVTDAGVSFGPIDDPLCAFLATSFTGGFFMGVAVILGGPIRASFPEIDPVDPADDKPTHRRELD